MFLVIQGFRIHICITMLYALNPTSTGKVLAKESLITQPMQLSLQRIRRETKKSNQVIISKSEFKIVELDAVKPIIRSSAVKELSLSLTTII